MAPSFQAGGTVSPTDVAVALPPGWLALPLASPPSCPRAPNGSPRPMAVSPGLRSTLRPSRGRKGVGGGRPTRRSGGDPAAREWTGVVLGEDIATLEGLGLAVEVRKSGLGLRPSPLPGPSVPGRRQPREPKGQAPAPKRDYAKAWVEAYAGRAEGLESARLSVLDVTSGLPDDDREEDQHARALVERQRQGRVRAAQTALSSADPAVAAQVFRDQVKLARFCARFSIHPSDICPRSDTTTELCSWCRGRHGVFQPIHLEDLSEVLSSPSERLAELRAREAAVLPGVGGLTAGVR